MSSFSPSPPTKSRQRWIIAILLILVLSGGVAKLILTVEDDAGEGQAEEYQIVDVTVPPPPPPPPPEEEEMEEPEDIEDPIEPLEMSSSPESPSEESSELDLGIDIGDLASSAGSGFAMEIPHFGRGGGGDADGDGGLMGSDEVTSPTPMNRTQPTYPSSLLKKGIGGKVLITCVVDDSGRVVSTSIKMSSGHPDLDKAAINAVNKWKFKPAKKGGKSVKATCVVPFNFEVKKA